MKNKIFAKMALTISIVFCPVLAVGDGPGLATGNLTTADACGFGIGYLGGFAGLGDDATSIFGSITYGLSDYTEGRIKLGFSDFDHPDADPELLIGIDLKYEFMDYYDKNKSQPMDMAFGAFIEYVNYQFASIWELGGNFIASIPYRFSSGHRLIPYGRANLRLEHASPDVGDGQSDFRFGLNMGVKYELTSEMNLYGELQIDGNTGLFTGLDIRAF